MSLYLIMMLILLAGVIVEFFTKKTPRVYYMFVFGALTLMLCLRYGQGIDYLSYEYVYYALPQDLYDALTNDSYHGEIGWRFLCFALLRLQVPFEAFVFVISLAQMFFLWRFIERHCDNRFLALFLSYHTLYLTYFSSLIRQGLVVSVFLGLLLDWVFEKKFIRYSIAVIVCILIHSASAILFAIPLFHLKIFKKLWVQIVLVCAAWMVGLLLASGAVSGLLMEILPYKVAIYFAETQLSLIAVAERAVTYAVTVFVYWHYKKNNKEKETITDLIMCIVSAGVAIYGLLCASPLVSSRVAYLFKVAELAILSSAAVQCGWRRIMIALFCIALAGAMTVKNVDSYVTLSEYYGHVNTLNYPYVSIFNKEDIITYKRSYYKDLIRQMGR